MNRPAQNTGSSDATTNPPRCPNCEYNLTGLTESRCPECGEPFDWEQVIRQAANPVTIAFERSRGVARVCGFVLTWATVLFAPWVFARQICARVSLAAGMVFAAVCCVPVTARSTWDLDLLSYAAWMTTIFLHILAQAALLTILDPNVRREGRRALRFWIAVGGYTTAVVVTECYEGPPFLDPKGLDELIFAPLRGRTPNFGAALDYGSNSWLGWFTLLLWLIPVIWCYVMRLKKRGVHVSIRIPMSLLAIGGLLVLYSYSSVRLAPWLWSVFGGSIG